jgi:TolB-like protein/DNA-binding winged helix-turn-helix (wHTH) protein/tetratricopeptide (TPR) repeat protein
MSQHPVHRFDDFEVDAERWRLSRGGQEIHLEPVVLKLLIYLIAHRERLVTRQELMDTVWGDTVISESALTKAVARLRKALDDDSATPRYLETVRSQGYRFVAPVEEVDSRDGTGPPPGRGGKVAQRRVLLAGAAVITALAILAASWIRTPANEGPQERAIHSLAVMPLDNLTGNPDQDYYADGLQDLLITELSQLPGLRVTSRQSTRRYRNSTRPTVDIAGELGVDALVEGSVLLQGSKIEVTIKLIDGRSDKHLWAERYASGTPHVYGLISDVTHAIGAEVGAAQVSREDEGARDDRADPIDPRAIEAYALGLMHFDEFTGAGIRLAIEQLEKAVEIEPDFALAWGNLAAAHALHSVAGNSQPRESMEACRIAALKAIEADDRASIGYSALGWTRLWSGDFDGGCESFDKALRINPSGLYAIHGKADCLMLEGRMDENIARLRELVAVSPFGTVHNLPLPSHLYMARRFDEAVAEATALQARVPRSSMHWILVRIYWQQGLFDKALEEARLELELRGDTVLLAALEEGLEAAGPTGAMRAMAEALAARADESYVDPYKIGETFARAGRVDEALHWLDKAVDNGSIEIMYIPFRPEFDILRSDPRYRELVERIFRERAPTIMRLGTQAGDAPVTR